MRSNGAGATARGLERQLQLRALDDDVGEVEQVHLERVEHAFPRDDDLLRLLLDGQRADDAQRRCPRRLGYISGRHVPWHVVKAQLLVHGGGAGGDFEEEGKWEQRKFLAQNRLNFNLTLWLKNLKR